MKEMSVEGTHVRGISCTLIPDEEVVFSLYEAGPPELLILTGPPGSGKTVLAAHLLDRSPEALRQDRAGDLRLAGNVPSAATFCQLTSADVPDVAQGLSDQLADSVPGFVEARQMASDMTQSDSVPFCGL
jgi:SpoVK/Ycf46/Vps4 family AAA+-type ATPase